MSGNYWENVRAVRNMQYGVDALGVLRPYAVEQTGAYPVAIQDQHSRTLFSPLSYQETGANFDLASPATAGDWTITAETGHGITPYTYIATGKADNWFGCNVVGVVGDVLTLDRVVNIDWPASQTFVVINAEMAIDASVTRQVYTTYPPYDMEYDITGMHIAIVCQTEPDDSAFGDIADGIAKGMSLRWLNGETGEYVNMGVARTNGQMALFTGGDVQYADKAGGGFYSVRVKAAWREVWGVTVRLRGRSDGLYTPQGRDEFQMIVQDDLSDLLSMLILAVGHVVIP